MNLNPREHESQFTLTYMHNTSPNFLFIRNGSEQEPIPELRYDRTLQHRQEEYEEVMKNPQRKVVRPRDFILDKDYCIDLDQSSGCICCLFRFANTFHTKK